MKLFTMLMFWIGLALPLRFGSFESKRNSVASKVLVKSVYDTYLCNSIQ